MKKLLTFILINLFLGIGYAQEQMVLIREGAWKPSQNTYIFETYRIDNSGQAQLLEQTNHATPFTIEGVFANRYLLMWKWEAKAMQSVCTIVDWKNRMHKRSSFTIKDECPDLVQGVWYNGDMVHLLVTNTDVECDSDKAVFWLYNVNTGKMDTVSVLNRKYVTSLRKKDVLKLAYVDFSPRGAGELVFDKMIYLIDTSIPSDTIQEIKRYKDNVDNTIYGKEYLEHWNSLQWLSANKLCYLSFLVLSEDPFKMVYNIYLYNTVHRKTILAYRFTVKGDQVKAYQVYKGKLYVALENKVCVFANGRLKPIIQADNITNFFFE